ncbi:hypothetical protein E3N88_30804 [Mikania micrantha]|uniref:Protein kinase domain-containing protein n=1 Tax=Mikania micrantha TaxID=192012 RepID=A0A5N6MMV4_9ASTR|nr:hypothetical protein E3N88_30804 [Mikania micrantha]
MNPVSPRIVEMASTLLTHFSSTIYKIPLVAMAPRYFNYQETTSQYGFCVPKDCGDGLNITYPFFINNLQDPSCGYPGFNLTCNNGSSILQLSGNDFTVKQIDRVTRHIRLQNAAILANQTEFCSSKIKNLTLDPNRFTFDNNRTTQLVLISNCSGTFSNDLERYRIRSCEKSREFVMAANDKNLRNVTDGCGGGGEIVEMPVELVGGEGGSVVVDGGNYTEVAERGFLLRWFSADCSDCERSAIGVGSPLLSFVLICAICYIMKFPLVGYIASLKDKSEDDKSVEAFIKQYGSLATKRYQYSDIKKMTNSFQLQLGRGGFGTVFQGKLSDGRLVAVKVLNSSRATGKEFINEVASIGRICHVNIVSLLGFCSDNQKRALVYEFMPNGSLEKFIQSHDSEKPIMQLEMKKLYEVALGVARGLDYLHHGCNPRILHLDIKPPNILLDQDFCPKIADFGLAKLYSRNESIVSMLEARGTIGYIAPEVFNRNIGGVSHKSDVYSYGMLILEMVGMNKNGDAAVGSKSTSDAYFPYWIYNRLEREEYVFDGISSVEETDYVRKMMIIGLRCIQTMPTQRPSIDQVIDMLEGSTGALDVPQKPSFSYPLQAPLQAPVNTCGTSQSEEESSYLKSSSEL